MSVLALLVSVALAGQVSGNNRYPAPPFQSTNGAAPRYGDEAPPAQNLPANVPATSVPPASRQNPTQPNLSGSYGDPRNGTSTTRPGSAGETQTGLKPSAMMRAMLNPSRGSQLSGQPMRLADVVSGAPSRKEQLARIDAYWDLCSSVADYYLGLREQEELQGLRRAVSSAGPALQAAESELIVRVNTSQKAAVATQFRLASMMGRGDPGSLPLPVDPPHCGDYYARYDQIFVNRSSPEAQAISELLPLRYEELKESAAAVTRSEDWLNSVATRNGNDTDGLLRALELLGLRRRAFVQIVRDYNRRIARYSELAAPGAIDPDQLIGMLIKREGVENTATRPTTVAPPTNRQSQSAPAKATRTFAEEWTPVGGNPAAATSERDDSVAPASAEEEVDDAPRVERSLLVKPD